MYITHCTCDSIHSSNVQHPAFASESAISDGIRQHPSIRQITPIHHERISWSSFSAIETGWYFFLCFIHGHSLSMLRQLLPCFTIHCFKQCHFPGFIYIYGCGVPTVLVVLPIIPLIHLLLSINPFSHYPMLNIQQGVRKSITRWMQFHLSRLQQTGWTIIQQREKENN